MSGIGGCPRAICAQRLGYDELPTTTYDKERLKHYTRMELIAAEQISDLGYELQNSGLCQDCVDRFGDERHGIHVEINTPLYELIGHLDRRLILEQSYPVEIKSLGKSSFKKFYDKRFEAFPEYAGQECCYLEAEQLPGIYWIMERDSGRNQKYIVNDYKNELSLPGFEKIELPITFDQILDKLNLIELSAQENVLIDGVASDMCQFCKFYYLCDKSDGNREITNDTTPHLISASDQYKAGAAMETEGKQMKSNAVAVLLDHMKRGKIDKYKNNVISLSFRGQRTKKWLDEQTIRKLAPDDIIRLAEKESAPFDDYTIRTIKGKNNEV